MIRRSLTFVYDSNIDNDLWEYMVLELIDTAEQAACDYAARVDHDEYEIDAFVGSSHYSGVKSDRTK